MIDITFCGVDLTVYYYMDDDSIDDQLCEPYPVIDRITLKHSEIDIQKLFSEDKLDELYKRLEEY